MKNQITIFFVCLYLTTMSTAQTTRQHDSHAHGAAELNIVVEGDKLAIELISPAVNIVGFEHAPSNDEHKSALAQAKQSLEQADKLFMLPEQAGCQPEHVHVESELLEEHHDDEHADEHDADADEDHADEHEHEEKTHSEFNVEYDFKCDDIEKLTQIQVNLFDAFPATEKLNVQLLTPSQQTALTLNRENFNIDL